MKVNKLAYILILLVLVAAETLQGQAKYSNEFLNLGVGAKGLSLANTQVAMVDDVTSGYWNPAGLANVKTKYQISLMHAAYFANIANYDYMGISYRIDERQTVGFTMIRFGVDGILNTTQLIDNQGNVNYDRITYFSVADWAALLSYGRKLAVEGLNVGVNFKIVHRRIGDFAHAWGFGLDGGLQYEIKKWKFGLMARDITSTFNAWAYQIPEKMKEVFIATGNELPENGLELTLPRLSLGFGRDFELGKGFTAMTTIDLDCPFGGKRNTILTTKVFTVDPHLGLEFGYKDIVYLRTGVGNLQKETDIDGKNIVTCQVNIGVGLTIKKVLTIDYALTDLGDISIALYSHIFSLKLALNQFKKS